MLQQNIEKFYSRIGIFLPPNGELYIRMKNGKSLVGNMPIQILVNRKKNLWDFGLPGCLLINGEDINAIVLWDRSYTRKYSDENPEGIVIGKSGTSRQERPSIY